MVEVLQRWLIENQLGDLVCEEISGLLDSLPNRSLIVFEGQEHNAMDNVPEQFAAAVTNFLLSNKARTTGARR